MSRAAMLEEIYLKVILHRTTRGEHFPGPAEELAKEAAAKADAVLPTPCGWKQMIKAIEDNFPNTVAN